MLILDAVIDRDVLTTYVIGYLGVVVFTAIVPAFIAAAIEQSRQLTEQLRQENADLEWALTRARSTSKQQQYVMSSALHGQVQAALSAAAYRLQQAINDGHDVIEASAQARLEAERAVEFDVDFAAPVKPFQLTLDEVAQLWSGVCEISTTLTEIDIAKIDQDRLCTRVATDVVIELCMNAIKHGNANIIDIHCKWPDDRTLELMVHDNGSTTTDEVAGMGTQMFDDVSLSWKRTSHERGTTVTLQLPWQQYSDPYIGSSSN